MRPPPPLEACMQIASEHAAGTLAALEDQRAARLAVGLAEYGKALSDLAGENDGHDAAEQAER